MVRHIICLQILQLTTQTIYINKIQNNIHATQLALASQSLQITDTVLQIINERRKCIDTTSVSLPIANLAKQTRS
jgi:hypothetical protein